MREEGVIIVQHGGFPRDFMDELLEIFTFIKEMINDVSRKTVEIERRQTTPYLVDMRKITRTHTSVLVTLRFACVRLNTRIFA